MIERQTTIQELDNAVARCPYCGEQIRLESGGLPGITNEIEHRKTRHPDVMAKLLQRPRWPSEVARLWDSVSWTPEIARLWPQQTLCRPGICRLCESRRRQLRPQPKFSWPTP